MPTYDYRCNGCGHTFEHFQGLSEPLLTRCPECRRKKLERLIGAGAGLIFRGSGFYITDYRNDAWAAAAKKDAPPGDGKPGDGKPGDGKPGDGKSVDSKTGDGKTGAAESGGTKATPSPRQSTEATRRAAPDAAGGAAKAPPAPAAQPAQPARSTARKRR